MRTETSCDGMRPVATVVDPEFWARGAGIALIDLALAGDNALVIALAVRTLPPERQAAGRVWGTVLAVALRVGLIVIVTRLLRIPLLQLAGGGLLVAIALRLARHQTGAEQQVRAGSTLVHAIGVIAVADAIMSLDNVLAVAAAARGRYSLVIAGIVLSLPLVVWGSGLLGGLMRRHAWIVWLAAGVLGYVAVEMILRDPLAVALLGPTAEALRYPMAAAAGVLLAGYAGWSTARDRT